MNALDYLNDGLYGSATEGVGDAIANVFKTIGAKIKEVWEAVVKKVKEFFGWVKEGFAKAKKDITKKVNDVKAEMAARKFFGRFNTSLVKYARLCGDFRKLVTKTSEMKKPKKSDEFKAGNKVVQEWNKIGADAKEIAYTTPTTSTSEKILGTTFAKITKAIQGNAKLIDEFRKSFANAQKAYDMTQGSLQIAMKGAEADPTGVTGVNAAARQMASTFLVLAKCVNAIVNVSDRNAGTGAPNNASSKAARGMLEQ